MAEGEEVDRLAATASSLREAVDVLRRRHTVEGRDGDGVAAVAENTRVAGRRAMGAVKELAGLLASEVHTAAERVCCVVFSHFDRNLW